jgi:hypothetical protein
MRLQREQRTGNESEAPILRLLLIRLHRLPNPKPETQASDVPPKA